MKHIHVQVPRIRRRYYQPLGYDRKPFTIHTNYAAVSVTAAHDHTYIRIAFAHQSHLPKSKQLQPVTISISRKAYIDVT